MFLFCVRTIVQSKRFIPNFENKDILIQQNNSEKYIDMYSETHLVGIPCRII